MAGDGAAMYRTVDPGGEKGRAEGMVERSTDTCVFYL